MDYISQYLSSEEIINTFVFDLESGHLALPANEEAGGRILHVSIRRVSFEYLIRIRYVTTLDPSPITEEYKVVTGVGTDYDAIPGVSMIKDGSPEAEEFADLFPIEESKQTEIDELVISDKIDDAAEDEDLLTRLVDMILAKKIKENKY